MASGGGGEGGDTEIAVGGGTFSLISFGVKEPFTSCAGTGGANKEWEAFPLTMAFGRMFTLPFVLAFGVEYLSIRKPIVSRQIRRYVNVHTANSIRLEKLH